MSDQQPGRNVIGFRTALLLYTALAVAACFVLKGNARLITLLIVFALAVKTALHYLRNRIE